MFKFGLGWIQFLGVTMHFTLKFCNFPYLRYQSVSISSQLPPWEYPASVPRCSLWTRWLENRIKGSRAENGYRAVRAVANEQQIIFKWALKINCVVLLTQSPKSCMVNFQHLHFTAVQLVFDEQWEFLMDSKLQMQMLFEISKASSYIPSHMYGTHLQFLSWSFFIQTQPLGRI